MTQEARFFDSEAGDRIYGAADWADIFRRFVTNGYVADDEEELMVTNAVGDRDIRVGLGAAWIEGRNFEIHTDGEIITLTAAGTGDRWDRVVVRMDTSERNVYLAILEGAEGGGKPALTRTSTRYEMSLAAILRPGGSTVVQDGDINDERNDETLFGVAQGHDVVMRSEPMTTAERDALSGSDLYVGRLVLNTDDSQLQWWDGSSWNNAHGHEGLVANTDLPEFATDYSSLQDAALAAANRGRPLYISGTWGLAGPVNLDTADYDGLTIFGDGEHTVIDVSAFGTNQGAFHIKGTKNESKALNSDAVEGSRTVTLGTEADATYLAGFEWLKIHSERSTGISGIKQGEWVQVESQSTNTITLRDALTDTYRTVDTAQITAFTMRNNITIRDLTIQGSTDETVMHGGIKTEFAHNISISGCRFFRTHYTGCMMWEVVGWKVTDCIFDEILSTGTGYGVASGWASQEGIVSNCVFRRMRHGFTTTGGSAAGTYGRSARISVVGCKAYHCTSSGFDTHQGAIDIVFDGCTVISGVGDIGILLRNNSASVTNCTIRNVRGSTGTNYGVQIVSNDEAPGQIIVANNNITGPSGEATFYAIGVESALDYPNWDGVVISGNRISECWLGIDIRNDQGHVMMPISVVGNTIVKAYGYGIYIDATPAVTVTGNSVRVGAGGIRGILVLNSPDVVISGNIFRGDSSTGRGIHLSGSSGQVITGNRVQTFEFGVYTSTEVSSAILMGNQLQGNTTPIADNATGTIKDTNSAGGRYNHI